MPDARFFESAQALSLAQLATATGAELIRGEPSALIETVAPLAQAGGTRLPGPGKTIWAEQTR